MSGCESPSKRHASGRRVGLKDVLKVMNDITCSTSRLVSSSSLSSTATVTLPLQQTVAVCTLLMMTDDSRNRVVNNEIMLGKVQRQHQFYGLFFRTNWVSQYQKVRTILDFNDAKDDGVAVASAGPYVNHLHFAYDRYLHQHLITQGLQAGCFSRQPAASKH